MGKYYKWNEITYEMMKDIFTSFVKRENWTKGKILEVQDPVALKEGTHERRMYIGSCINLRDFMAYDEPFITVLERLSEKNKVKMEDFFENGNGISICILEDKNPTIIPLFAEDAQCQIIMATCFGDPFAEIDKDIKLDTSQAKWYIKDEKGKRVIDQRPCSFRNYTNKERFIRTRTVDYDTWFQNIMNYLEKGKQLEACEEDFKADEFEIKKEGEA